VLDTLKHAPYEPPELRCNGKRLVKLDRALVRPHEAMLPRREARIGIIAAFALAIAFLGGSSHPDVAQLTVLRPLAALFFIPALYYATKARLSEGRTLLLLLLGLGFIMALQAVPLPPVLWQELPGRDAVVELGRLLDVEGTWRPVSWVPSRTLNALASLVVPAAALLLALSLATSRSVLLHTILGIALFCALMTCLQILSGGNRVFYLYSTLIGRADGLFSNENHSGVFLALAMLVSARLAAQTSGERAATLQTAIYGACFVFFFVSILIGGSRAAFVCAIIAIVVAGTILRSVTMARNSQSRRSRPRSAPGLSRYAMPTIGVVLAAGLIFAFFLAERSPSLDDIFRQDSFEDMRWRIAPILWTMIEQNWLFGIGFGAFEEYYHIYEPAELLLPRYINQAHNDWGQYVLEGGLAGTVLLLGILAWVFKRLFLLWRSGAGERDKLLFWAGWFAILAAASTIDYPLRTPIFQVIAIWSLLVLERDSRMGDYRS
jgi:O-antigen ligase